jgi:hypothetical protein
MRDVDVIVLSRFPEIFEGFLESLQSERDFGVVVWDNPQPSQPCGKGQGWFSVNVYRPFNMAHNGNVGLHYAESSSDVLYCGDDTRIIEPDTIKRLQALAYSDEKIGILSPQIVGLCASDVLRDDGEISDLAFVGFVFVYIKREVIERIGYLDERFTGYGFEDIDYCYRARQAGFKIGMAKTISVQHGVNGKGYGSTFIRTTGEPEMAKQDVANRRRFAEKWGLDPDDTAGIFAAIRDLSATVSR